MVLALIYATLAERAKSNKSKLPEIALRLRMKKNKITTRVADRDVAPATVDA